jgi:hypothetical protein
VENFGEGQACYKPVMNALLIVAAGANWVGARLKRATSPTSRAPCALVERSLWQNKHRFNHLIATELQLQETIC